MALPQRPSLHGFWVYYTSSIAITTSTVSKLSRPRSFEKCDTFVSCSLFRPRSAGKNHSMYLRCIGYLDRSVTSAVLFGKGRTHLVKVLEKIHDPPLNFRLRQPRRCRIASYRLQWCYWCRVRGSGGKAWSDNSGGRTSCGGDEPCCAPGRLRES